MTAADPVRMAESLIDVLTRENAALAAVDYPAAATLLAEKQTATEALLRAGPAGVGDERWRAALARLDASAAENRALLARAIRVQGRVMALLARAAPPERATYGTARPAGAAPMAISLRA